jgi:hypothetical protein
VVKKCVSGVNILPPFPRAQRGLSYLAPLLRRSLGGLWVFMRVLSGLMFIPGVLVRAGCFAFFRPIFPMLAVDVYKIGAVSGVCGWEAWRNSSGY